MKNHYRVYGRKGSGSIPIEAALLLLDEPFEVIELVHEQKEAAGSLSEEDFARINPMQQLPALLLPNGELMTESAAILIFLADTYPAARLGPQAADPKRAAFLRWMIFLSTQIYGLIWARDDPSRLAANADHEALILDRTAERIALCWRMMEAQIRPGRYSLGENLSVLDLYLTVLSCWGPRRPRFCQEAPKLADVVKRVEEDPRLREFWQHRLG